MIRMNKTTVPLPTKPHASVQQLANAPHRLMFFIGASTQLLAMAWWLGEDINAQQLIGAAAVMTGVMLLIVEQVKRHE